MTQLPPPTYPDGHFYSPVVDPQAAMDYTIGNRSRQLEELSEINFNPDMKAFFTRNEDTITSHKFPPHAEGGRRFYTDNRNFPLLDAMMLRTMIYVQKPKRIIEIGSGFSTACILDACDEFNIKPSVTCIDPYCDRLKSILTTQDKDWVKILEVEVQKSNLSIYDDLEENDILFIDSSHVVKTGSDVHFELFYIMRRLKKGVLVHFHDVRYPFEYSDHMLLRMRTSWNEAYVLQAFLMYNYAFQVYYWNGLVQELMKRDNNSPENWLLKENAGSSIWLRRL